MKKIVFLGNCQATRLYILFNEKFLPILGGQTELVVNFIDLERKSREAMEQADVIVAQVTDAEQKTSLEKIETKARIIRFPYVTGNFLWPYSGQAHVRNAPLPELQDGPYGAQYGNPWLNARIKKGAKPEDIAAEYEALDIPKLINLDRTFELSMERARERDSKSDTSIAALIEKSLTDIPLFMTPANLELALFNPLAKDVYERLGVQSTTVDLALNTLWRSPFPVADQPIHPSVARHFGLKFIGPDTRYRTFTGERLTFREWIDRYVRYQWNHALLRGAHKSGRLRQFNAEAEAALAQIDSGLAQSEGSAYGEAGRSHLLTLKGDHAGALAAAARAAAFDTTNPNYVGTLLLYTAGQGKLTEAENIGRHMLVTWPYYADGWVRFGIILMRLGKVDEAIAAVERATQIEPLNPDHRKSLASTLAQAGQYERARSILSGAIAISPERADLQVELSRLLVQSGDLDNALIAARRAVELDPGDAAAQGHLADILTRRGDIVGAVNAVTDAVAKAPGKTNLHVSLSELLSRLGRHEEAGAALSAAIALEPANPGLRYHLAQILMQRSAFAEAEDVLAEALSLNSSNDSLHAALAHVLARQGRFNEAEASLRRAMQLRPDNASLHQALAELLYAAGQLEASEAAYRTAIDLAPRQADWRASLALIVSRQGRLDDSLTIIEDAVAIDPENPHLLAKYSHILKEKRLFAHARGIAETAIRLAPRLSGLHATLADICAKDGDLPGAIDAYRNAIRLDSDNQHYKKQIEYLERQERAAHDAEAAE
jgi:tetratricopeptide (TPR) repeat protein